MRLFGLACPTSLAELFGGLNAEAICDIPFYMFCLFAHAVFESKLVFDAIVIILK